MNKLINLNIWLKTNGFKAASVSLEGLIKESMIDDHPGRWDGAQGFQSDVSSEVADGLQLALDAIGLIPGYGEPFDAINAIVSVYRDEPIQAILSTISIIPMGGDIVGKGAKILIYLSRGIATAQLGSKIYTVSGLANHVLEAASGIGDEAIQASLNMLDIGMKQPKGSAYALYLSDIKKPIEQMAKEIPV